MANSLKSEEELIQKIFKEYLSRVERLLRWKKVQRKAWFIMEKQYKENKKTFWREEDNLMNLDVIKTKETCKCFKCGKPEYIQRFCRNKDMKIVNVSDLKNEDLLTSEKSQKEEL